MDSFGFHLVLLVVTQTHKKVHLESDNETQAYLLLSQTSGSGGGDGWVDGYTFLATQAISVNVVFVSQVNPTGLPLSLSPPLSLFPCQEEDI